MRCSLIFYKLKKMKEYFFKLFKILKWLDKRATAEDFVLEILHKYASTPWINLHTKRP